MVKINVEEQEAKAFVEYLAEGKMSADIGFFLTNLKIKMMKAFKAASDEAEGKGTKTQPSPSKKD